MLTWLDERLIDYADVRLILYGVVLIVLFIGFRRGVVPALLDQVRRAWRDTTPRPPERSQR